MIKKMFKSKKFLKILLIPYGIWFLFTLFAMIPEKGETDPLTFGDVIIANFAVLIIWFILLVFMVGMLIYLFYKEKKISAYLNILYFLWILYASYLTIGIYLLN